MRLGWKIFIPVTLVWIVVEGVLVVLQDRTVGEQVSERCHENACQFLQDLLPDRAARRPVR